MENLEPRGWYSRGYLPHFDAASVTQFITFHLADSLPQEVLARWTDELRSLKSTEQQNEMRSRIMKYLDSGVGACWLRDPTIAYLVEEAFRHFDEDRYRLLCWTIMPNHVHLLVTLTGSHSMSTTVHSWKSYTSTRANKLLGRTGEFWYREYYDRFIRDRRHYDNVVAYIDRNPVKAGLCSSPDGWAFGSARFLSSGLEGRQDAGDPS
jgi:REP element-mobilizing transposase RayT